MRQRHAFSNYFSEFQGFIRSGGGRWTRERLSLMKAIFDCNHHFTPDELVARLQSQGMNVSLTTVYRNLEVWLKCGMIRRACLAGESAGGLRYERVWGRSHHDHLVCEDCGRQEEFCYSAIEALQELVAREHNFLLKQHHLELRGICGDCQAKKSSKLPVVVKQADTRGKQEANIPAKKEPTKLSLMDLKKGEIGEVASFSGVSGLTSKLNAIGIRRGDCVRRLRTGPFQGPLMVENIHSGLRVMIARELASAVKVRRPTDVRRQ